MARTTAPDDIVARPEDATGNGRPPLLVLEPLAAFLDAAGLGDGAVEAVPIGDGHSNETFLLRRGATEVVLRRPPRPPLPPSAHDVLREARLLRALEPTPVRVPRVLATCDDERVVGGPFYVMEHLGGEVITDAVPEGIDPATACAGLIDALVEVHAVDWRAQGLDGFGRPEGYCARQVRRFRGLWEVNRTRDLLAVERVADWLERELPESGPATIVHGDFRLGNVMLAPPGRLVAIFDWELATIGDPLADVGYLCALWAEPDDPPLQLRDHVGGVSRAPGFFSRAELVARYEQRSGRTMTDIRWYTVLALWKAAVFMEGNLKRALSGASDDAYARDFADGVAELAEAAEVQTR